MNRKDILELVVKSGFMVGVALLGYCIGGLWGVVIMALLGTFFISHPALVGLAAKQVGKVAKERTKKAITKERLARFLRGATQALFVAMLAWIAQVAAGHIWGAVAAACGVGILHASEASAAHKKPESETQDSAPPAQG